MLRRRSLLLRRRRAVARLRRRFPGSGFSRSACFRRTLSGRTLMNLWRRSRLAFSPRFGGRTSALGSRRLLRMRRGRGGWFCRVSFIGTSRTRLRRIFPRRVLVNRVRLFRVVRSVALVRRNKGMVGSLGPVRRGTVILRRMTLGWMTSRRPVLGGTIFSSTISRRSRGARFLRRHGRSVIGPTSSLGRYHTASTELSRTRRRSHGWTSMIGRREQCAILTCGMLLLGLRRHRRTMRFVSVGFLLRTWARAYSALAAVECHMRIVIHDDGTIYVDVGDVDGVYMHDGRVVEEAATAPFTAIEAVAAVSVSVIDATVESNLRTPISGIPEIGAVVPAPVAGRPQQARFGSFDPGARHPVVSVVIAPCPIARSPHVPFTGTDRLLINR